MRKLLACFLVLLILVILIAAGLFLYLRNKAAQPKAIVIPTSSKVEVRNADSEAYYEIIDQTDVPEGASVRTSADGAATVILADNSIFTLDVSTEVKLSDVPDSGGNSTSIEQFLGNTWHRVQSVSSGSTYQVQTATVVAAVRGTIFGVDSTEDSSDVYVIESKVAATPIERQSGKRLSEQLIGAAQNLSIQKQDILNDVASRLESIPEHIKVREWFTDNQDLDQAIEKLKESGQKLFDAPQRLRDKLDISPELLRRQSEQNLFGRLFGAALQGLTNQPTNTTDSTKDITEDTPIRQPDTTTPDEVDLDKLEGLYANPEAGANFCIYMQDSEYQQSLQMLREFYSSYPGMEEVSNYFTEVEDSCQDGKIDDAELQRLQQLGDQLSGVDTLN